MATYLRRQKKGTEIITNRWMTVKQISQYLSLSERKIRQMVKDREIPFVRVGRRLIRFDRKAIDTWLEEKEQKTAGRIADDILFRAARAARSRI